MKPDQVLVKLAEDIVNQIKEQQNPGKSMKRSRDIIIEK